MNRDHGYDQGFCLGVLKSYNGQARLMMLEYRGHQISLRSEITMSLLIPSVYSVLEKTIFGHPVLPSVSLGPPPRCIAWKRYMLSRGGEAVLYWRSVTRDTSAEEAWKNFGLFHWMIQELCRWIKAMARLDSARRLKFAVFTCLNILSLLTN